ncbi:MAG: hypothetical protein JKY93_02620 [Gammaproteobacteria bacterium]|nr:hypothetical protein [Gammaproteobacteria bacterium]
MYKPKNLVITKLGQEYHEAYLNLCELLELTKDQLLILLLTEKGVIDGGIENAFPDKLAQDGWEEVLIKRFFDMCNLSYSKG